MDSGSVGGDEFDLNTVKLATRDLIFVERPPRDADEARSLAYASTRRVSS
jgi:hypothetical protein